MAINLFPIRFHISTVSSTRELAGSGALSCVWPRLVGMIPTTPSRVTATSASDDRFIADCSLILICFQKSRWGLDVKRLPKFEQISDQKSENLHVTGKIDST